MIRERALEIIAAYGGDARRWPADEGLAVLRLAARDPDVAAAIAEAQQFDALLAGWAVAVPDRRFDAAVLLATLPGVAIPAPPSRAARGWLAGGALAATVAGALLVMPGAPPMSPGAAPPQAAAVALPSQPPAVAPPAVPAPTGPTMMVADAGEAPAPPAMRPAAGAVPVSDTEIFATVFTPTLDEDELI